ncbi:MAG: shikimate dehydrogenase [Prochlorococcaceae cyanobacterium]
MSGPAAPSSPPISGHTRLLAVLGDPVRHSLSPAMHNAALRQLGLDWVYLALPVPAADLPAVLRALAASGAVGANVTIPHKQAAVVLADELTPLARRLGAVNTLVRREAGGWLGTNTDVEGFLAPLGGGDAWRGRRAVVLGCGGSARAVVAGLEQLGLAQLAVAARDPERLTAFLDGVAAWVAPAAVAWHDLPVALAGADLVVNTTPIGMASANDPAAVERSPLAAAALAALPRGATVYDLIYTPRPTSLLRQAAAHGCRVIDGLEMLVQQGAAALRLWTGQGQVPVGAMRSAALAQLGGP